MAKPQKVDFTLPKPIYLQTEADFKKFEDALKALAERYLSIDWEWTFKIGGKVHKEIQKREPGSAMLKVIEAGDFPSFFTPPEHAQPFSPLVKTPVKTPEKGRRTSTTHQSLLF